MIVWYQRYEEWRGKVARRFESPERRKLRMRLERYERKRAGLNKELFMIEQEIFEMKKELGEL